MSTHRFALSIRKSICFLVLVLATTGLCSAAIGDTETIDLTVCATSFTFCSGLGEPLGTVTKKQTAADEVQFTVVLNDNLDLINTGFSFNSLKLDLSLVRNKHSHIHGSVSIRKSNSQRCRPGQHRQWGVCPDFLCRRCQWLQRHSHTKLYRSCWQRHHHPRHLDARADRHRILRYGPHRSGLRVAQKVRPAVSDFPDRFAGRFGVERHLPEEKCVLAGRSPPRDRVVRRVQILLSFHELVRSQAVPPLGGPLLF